MLESPRNVRAAGAHISLVFSRSLRMLKSPATSATRAGEKLCVTYSSASVRSKTMRDVLHGISRMSSRELLANPVRCAAFGARGQALVSDRYTWNSTAHRIAAHIKQSIGIDGPGSNSATTADHEPALHRKTMRTSSSWWL